MILMSIHSRRFHNFWSVGGWISISQSLYMINERKKINDNYFCITLKYKWQGEGEREGVGGGEGGGGEGEGAREWEGEGESEK